METLKEVNEEGLNEEGLNEEGNEEVGEEAIRYKRFGNSKALPIYQDEFDILNHFNTNESIKKFKFANQNGIKIEVMDYGATILSITMPDKYEKFDDVLLGFDTVQEYYKRNCIKFGAMIGRTSDVIENALFKIEEDDINVLTKNADAHHRDGGVVSFDQVLWQSYIDKVSNTLVLTYLSEHEEEGYPGNLLTKILMHLTDENEFIITITAECDQITPVDISPRLFFNLGGHGAGEDKMRDHKVMINSDMYIMHDRNGVPTGRLKHVNGTYFDLRTPRPFYAALDRIRGGGYNHTFCLNNTHRNDKGILFACRLEESNSGRYIEIWTDAPGLLFTTANNFPECPTGEEEETYPEELGSAVSQPPSKNKHTVNSKSGVISNSYLHMERLFGKKGMMYFRHGAVALAPQGYPNSVNMPKFPTILIQPNEKFQRKIIYKLGVSPKIIPYPRTAKEKYMMVKKEIDQELDETM